MHKASVVMAEGADFILIGATYTMLRSEKPVVAVCAVRTGCRKSQATHHVCKIMKAIGKMVVVIRHPMPYGDLTTQVVQRFSPYEDFERHHCTIEEREEIDLPKLLYDNKPTLRVRYEYRDHDSPILEEVLLGRLKQLGVLSGSQP